MTKCTETCDAEKAVLVGALERIRERADQYRQGLAPVESASFQLHEAGLEAHRALAGTSPAAAALLAQGERIKVARGKVMMIDASPAGSLNAQLKAEALAALAPGEEE